MAPIIISPGASYEDPVIAKNGVGVISKENLHILNEAALTASASTLSELEQEVGEDNDVVNINGERQQSNLFEDEKNDSTRIKLPSIQTSYLGNEHNRPVPSPQYYDSASAPLSLMQSFSPTQQITGGLEDININSPNSSQPQIDDNYALNMLIDEELARKLQDDQYTSDAALARQLQEEEDKMTSNPKTKVLPSVADSFFGPPNPMEVKSQYKRVNKGQSSSYSLSGISNWITSTATDFFGEDVNMQGHTRSSSSARGKKDNNQYRNAV